jgi:hypothetical protein
VKTSRKAASPQFPAGRPVDDSRCIIRDLVGIRPDCSRAKTRRQLHGCVRLQRWGSLCRARPPARTFIPDGALWEMNIVERRLVDHAAGGVSKRRGKSSFSDKVSGEEEQLVGRNGRDASSVGEASSPPSCSAQRLPGARMDIFRERNRGRPYYNRGGGGAGHDLQHRLEKHIVRYRNR